MKKKVIIKKIYGKVVITSEEVYTISKFAAFIPELKEGLEYEVEVDDRRFLYNAKLIDNDKNKIKGLIIIDFETSGTDFNKHYPLSIGLIVTDNDLKIQNVYYSDIYAPKHDYEKKALEINGLKFENGKKPHEVVNDINKIVKNWKEYRIAGWNIHFDYMFLKRLYNLANAELKCNYNLIDIQSLFSMYYFKTTGKWEIKSMRDAYKILFKSELPQTHNAIEDCIFELKILRKLLAELKKT